MSWGILGTLVCLSFLDMASPAIIGVTLYILLSRSNSAARPLAVYLSTITAFYFAFGCSLILGLGKLVDHLVELSHSPVLAWGALVVGVALSALGLVVRSKPGLRLRPPALKARSMVGLGLATAVVGAGTALPYLGAIGVMTAAGLPAVQWVPALAVYNIVMVSPSILLYLGHRTLGTGFRDHLRRWRERLEAGSRKVTGWMLTISGAALAVSGLVGTGVFTGAG
ncbi:GAP family protein [Nocardiopsis metallicus]|uniref:Cytochrome c biogenesis protein CcdA n=1 Tax=Nocardiopsis metallicus TaxID=179819 RepID=A0A840WJ23_9ACTN|nr:GAP family protein [Nocardiopsis metallicus]MBB5491885.1 cytochrome c biogenesis protein CcdA [Nocardiopsis metallicus]